MKWIYSFLVLLIYTTLGYAQMGKISPYLRCISMEFAQNARSMTRPQERYTIAFVRTDDVTTLRDNGCSILASWDDIHIARIPLSRLMALASKPEILRIEANEPCSVTNDTTISIVGVCASPDMIGKVKDVRNTYGLTGKGVVIGVEDIGFDLTNPNYLPPDGHAYRVKAVWDQLDWSENGDPVKFRVSEDSVYTAPGRQYIDEASILHKGCTADSLFAYHGTHTSGTAAGSGLGSDFQKPVGKALPYGGMAPEADLCLVGNIVDENISVVPKEHLSEYTSATDLLGFKYMFDYAESVGKPCVINFSEGTHQNLKDNALYDEVLQKMVGKGRILCVSAGNQGFKGSYIHKAYDEQRRGAFLTSKSKYAYYTLCSTEPARFGLTFYNTDGEKKNLTFNTSSQTLHPDSVVTDTIEVFDSLYVVATEVYASCYDKDRYVTEILIEDVQTGLFGLSSLPVALTLEETGYEADAYASGGYFTTNALDESLCNYTCDHNILFPGSSPAVITVGMTGYVAPRVNLYGEPAGVGEGFGTDGVLSGFGSKGPTMAGIMKPDVVAPGVNLISAHNSFYYQHKKEEKDDWIVNISEWNGKEYPWRLNTGTSMSTPVVVGIIALWLEKCPTLTPDDIRDVFAHTCRHGDASLSYPNNGWGWGEIDAVAGLEYIMQHYTGIDVINAESSNGSNCLNGSSSSMFDLTGRRVVDASSYHGIVVSADGRRVVR